MPLGHPSCWQRRLAMWAGSAGWQCRLAVRDDGRGLRLYDAMYWFFSELGVLLTLKRALAAGAGCSRWARAAAAHT